MPNPHYAGAALVSYSLTSALGISNIATVTFTTSIDPGAIADEVDGLARGFVTARGNLLARCPSRACASAVR